VVAFVWDDPEYHSSAYLRATGAVTPGNSILREGLDWGSSNYSTTLRPE
jgi:hypothetical protein